jgi:hypothetical protein
VQRFIRCNVRQPRDEAEKRPSNGARQSQGIMQRKDDQVAAES